MADNKEFGIWLASARKARGFSQESLAEAAGVTQEYISGLERGVRNPSKKMVNAAAKALSPKDADSTTIHALLNAGLKAAGFASTGIDVEPMSSTLEPLTSEQKLKLWESMGARTYYGPEPEDEDFELSENPDDWPPDLREALQEALFFTRIIPPEFVKTVFQLWRDQARAHAGVALNNKVMDAALKDNRKDNS